MRLLITVNTQLHQILILAKHTEKYQVVANSLQETSYVPVCPDRDKFISRTILNTDHVLSGSWRRTRKAKRKSQRIYYAH